MNEAGQFVVPFFIGDSVRFLRFLAIQPLLYGLGFVIIPIVMPHTDDSINDLLTFAGLFFLGLAIFLFVFDKQIEKFFGFIYGFFERTKKQEKVK